MGLLRRPTTNNSPLLKSPTLASNQLTKWSNVTQGTVNTWPAVCCTEVMLSLKMSTLLLLPSRPRGLSSLLTGAQLVSKSVLTTNHQLLSQVVISLKSNVPYACCPIPRLSLRLGLGLTTSLISCTLNVLSFTGMSVKVWKKVNSQRLGKILPPSRRTTKRLVSTQSKANKRKKVMNSKKILQKLCNALKKFRSFMLIKYTKVK